MADIKKYVAAFGLVAASALSTGCASTHDNDYRGGATPNNQYMQQESQTKPGYRTDGKSLGVVVRYQGGPPSTYECYHPDQFVDTVGGNNEYCFNRAQIDALLYEGNIPGAPIPQRRRGVADMAGNVHNQVLNEVVRNANIGDDKKGWISVGANGRGTGNAINEYAFRDDKKRACLLSFVLAADTSFNTLVPETPRQLGTFDNCVNTVTDRTAKDAMGDFRFKFGKFNIGF